jgi:transcriptional regulator with XRE-family HTH domain
MRGMSQSELGKAVGVTFQQIQKYECGKNRVAASVLYRISRALDVSVIEFFAGWDGVLPDEPQIWLSADEKRLLIAYRAVHTRRGRENILRLAEETAAYRLDG